jgi:hypothetical protein
MAELYDLIFIGIDAEDTNRNETISNISQLLEVEAKEIKYLLDNKLSGAIKQGLSIAAVRKFQKDLVKLGAVCNYRPSQLDGSALELAPVELPTQQFIFTCPACKHQQGVDNEADFPKSCPKCGIIPSKFEKVSEYKQARGIGGKLNPPNLREPQPQDTGEQAATNQPAWQFPQSPQNSLTSALTNVWLEPTAPKKSANTGFISFASAALFWAIGAIMGGVAVSAYYELKHRGAAEIPLPAIESPPPADAPTAQPEPTPTNLK